MDALMNVPGILTLTELVASIIDRFGAINSRLKMTTEKDLREPTSGFVVAVYQEYLRDLKIEVTVSPEQTNKFEYPDANMDALPMFNIFAALRKFFEEQNANFSMLDLVSPTFRRTYGGIAVMENYINFCQSDQEELSPHTDSILGKINSIQAVCDLKDQLTAKANEQAAARSQRVDKVAKLNLVLSATKTEIGKVTLTVEKKTSEEAEVMKVLQEAKVKTNALKMATKQLQDNISELENLVVTDPGEIERVDDIKKESLKEMNEQINSFKENLELSQKQNQMLEQMFEMTVHFKKYLKTSNKLKTVKDEEESLLSNKDGNQDMHGPELKSMRDEFRKKEAIVNKLKDNLTSEKAKVDNKLKTMEKTVRQLEIDRAKLEKKNVANNQSCMELLPVIKELQKKADQWIDAKTRCEAFLAEQKNAMDKKMKEEVAEIDKVLDKVRATGEALHAKVTKERAEAKKLLTEQKAKDAAEGRIY